VGVGRQHSLRRAASLQLQRAKSSHSIDQSNDQHEIYVRPGQREMVE
jgi:hypothetical protein